MHPVQPCCAAVQQSRPVHPPGLSMPASMRMKVVLPVPFSPSITMISESVNSPASTCDASTTVVQQGEECKWQREGNTTAGCKLISRVRGLARLHL